MPYINIRIATKLSNNQRSALATKTTSLMETVMGKRREVTVVHIAESSPQQWAINASILTANDATAAYVDIKITQGTNTAEQKAQMIAETITMLRQELGTLQQASYVVIDEIPANSWGYDGKTQAERATLTL